MTPLCSNASELVSSLVFASKKLKVNSSMTYSQVGLNKNISIPAALIFAGPLALWCCDNEQHSVSGDLCFAGVRSRLGVGVQCRWVGVARCHHMGVAKLVLLLQR